MFVERRVVMTPKTARVDDDTCQVQGVHLDRLIEAKKSAVPERDLQRLGLIYKAFGDPTRLKILSGLRGGEMCVCDLAAWLGLSQSAVSHHLRRLRDLALVKGRRDGKIVYYDLDDDHVADLLDIGLKHVRE
jgi:DNA-binding transcriptional ArsR family regulator